MAQLPLPSKGLLGERFGGCQGHPSHLSGHLSETSQSQALDCASEELQQAQVCLFWRGLDKREVRILQRLKNNQLISKTSTTWSRQRWVGRFLLLFQLQPKKKTWIPALWEHSALSWVHGSPAVDPAAVRQSLGRLAHWEIPPPLETHHSPQASWLSAELQYCFLRRKTNTQNYYSINSDSN